MIDSDDGRDGWNAVTFATGAGAVEGAWVIPSVVGTVEKVLDNLVGSGDVQLINVVNLGPRDSGEGGEATAVAVSEGDDTGFN